MRRSSDPCGTGDRLERELDGSSTQAEEAPGELGLRARRRRAMVLRFAALAGNIAEVSAALR